MTSRAVAASRAWGSLSAAPYATAALVGLSLVTARLLLEPARLRVVIAAVIAIALLGFALHSPRVLLAATVLWLGALGTVRRLVTEVGTSTKLDPLLLVGPVALVVLVFAALRGEGLVLRTALSKAVLALCALTLLGAVNPLGGSFFGGIAGLLFVFVPMLGFWVGRGIDDRTMRLVIKVVVVVGLSAAVYGLAQTLIGFPPWDRLWIQQVTFASLNVNGVIRPFATFSSAQEFAVYLSVAMVVLVGVALRAVRYVPLAIAALALLVPALILESSRGSVVLCVIALGAMLGARARMPLGLAAGLGALLLVALVIGLRSFGPSATGQSSTSALVSHEVSGLSDPLNPQSSTLGAHLSLLGDGLRSALANPVGRGIATVTIAGVTFGGVTAGTELDPSNVGLGLGLPGLIAYLIVFGSGIRRAYAMAGTRRDLLSMIGLGIVVVTMFQWLNGGLYSIAFIPWLVLGWTDRRMEKGHGVSATARDAV